MAPFYATKIFSACTWSSSHLAREHGVPFEAVLDPDSANVCVVGDKVAAEYLNSCFMG